MSQFILYLVFVNHQLSRFILLTAEDLLFIFDVAGGAILAGDRWIEQTFKMLQWRTYENMFLKHDILNINCMVQKGAI